MTYKEFDDELGVTHVGPARGFGTNSSSSWFYFCLCDAYPGQVLDVTFALQHFGPEPTVSRLTHYSVREPSDWQEMVHLRLSPVGSRWGSDMMRDDVECHERLEKLLEDLESAAPQDTEQ